MNIFDPEGTLRVFTAQMREAERRAVWQRVIKCCRATLRSRLAQRLSPWAAVDPWHRQRQSSSC